MEILITALIVIAVVFILYKNFKNHLKDNVVVAADVLQKEVVLVEKITRSKNNQFHLELVIFIINYIFQLHLFLLRIKHF